MPLSSGVKLGPYEIMARLGAGGMGEVYRAKDTRLDRTVAIKVLPSHLSSNPDLRQRFEREARAVSSLNHPHICTLHDVGHQDGIDFLVMEYIEGETLANRISKGALPLEQTLRYGMQIAEALDKAHRNGITHRDLKPGNIMLTKSGIKLLDFGLAKLHAGIPADRSAVSVIATELPPPNPLTGVGTILGTVQYMSPEQLEGRDADARSDLWAFGCVLYEMATGQCAFEGKSQASIIAAIMHSQPAPMISIKPLTPPAFEHVVATCLAKDPDDRWQSASDVRRELLWISGASQSLVAPAVSVVHRSRREVFAWAMIVLLAGLLTMVLLMRRQPSKVSLSEISRFVIESPPGTEFGTYDSQALSPDGRNLAFTASRPDGTLLWIRSLNSLEPRMLPGTEDAHFPFWSPDNRYIAFFAQGKMKKIDISGGSPETITDAENGRGGAWSPNGVIVFTPNFWSPLFEVSANGGKPRPITSLKSPVASATHRWPLFLPDGKHFLYMALTLESGKPGRFCAGLLGDQISTCFATGDSAFAYADPGYLLFIRDSTLVAQRFDLNSMQLTGTPVRIASGVGRFGAFGPTCYSSFSVASNGILTYSKTELPVLHLRMYDGNGTEIATFGTPALFVDPTFSADGQKIAVNRQDATGFNDVWGLDPIRGSLTRLTFHSGLVWSPVISRHSNQLAYTLVRPGFGSDLLVTTATGAGTPRLVWESGLVKLSDNWSPNDSILLVGVINPETRTDIWAVPMKGNGKPFPVIQTTFDESGSSFSPDGHFIAYTSDESGRPEIYAQSFPVTGQKWQISTQGGTQAQWGNAGKKLFYLSPSLDLMAVDIRTSPRFETGIPHLLFHTSITSMLANVEGRNQYAVDPNGRFLIVSGDATTEPRQITVVLNWQSEMNSLK